MTQAEVLRIEHKITTFTYTLILHFLYFLRLLSTLHSRLVEERKKMVLLILLSCFGFLLWILPECYLHLVGLGVQTKEVNGNPSICSIIAGTFFFPSNSHCLNSMFSSPFPLSSVSWKEKGLLLTPDCEHCVVLFWPRCFNVFFVSPCRLLLPLMYF